MIKGVELSVDNVECEKLKARYEHLYASVYVKVQVKSSEMKRALELMCEKSWPNGVPVRRYFSPKSVMENTIDCLRVSSFKCRSIKSSLQEVKELCSMSHFVFLQNIGSSPATCLF